MTAKRRTTILGFGALVAVLYALWRLIERRQHESGVTWVPQPFPMPPRPVPVTADTPAPAGPDAEPELVAETEASAAEDLGATGDAPWVEAVDGTCPASHPVKGKLSSGIYHLPGGQMYDRTRADRCYAGPEAAVADGLRASKR